MLSAQLEEHIRLSRQLAVEAKIIDAASTFGVPPVQMQLEKDNVAFTERLEDWNAQARIEKCRVLKEGGATAAEVKAAGKYRQEGKTYVVKDGDIIHFQFNVTAPKKK